MDDLESSNTSSNGKDTPKATIPGKTPIKHTPSNTPISARRRIAATTLRLAWSHPISCLVHPVRRRPTTRTSPHKFVLTTRLNHQSSIYVPSIDHNDLAHIPNPSSCRQA